LDGVSGFHAIPYSLTDYASKLDMILSDNERWREMSRGALIWSSSFTWDSHIDLLEGTLDEERR
jgi:glycosyltransferase involved in cell wall biosynthesis